MLPSVPKKFLEVDDVQNVTDLTRIKAHFMLQNFVPYHVLKELTGMKIWLINKTRWRMVTGYFEYAQKMKIKYKSGKFSYRENAERIKHI